MIVPGSESGKRRLLYQLSCLGLIELCLIFCAFAQEDVPGAKDHPLFQRMPGYFIAKYEERPSGSYEFITDAEQSARVQGFYLRIEYALKEGAAKQDPADIGRNYLRIMTRNGGEQVYESKNSIEPRWASRIPTGTPKQVWLEVTVREEGKSYTLTMMDGVVAVQKVDLSSVEELSRELRARGTARLSRIYFEPGKSKLKPSSEPPLVIVAELMKNEPALKLEIRVDPADSQNAKTAGLIRRRQEKIMNFLTAQGIPFSRVRSARTPQQQPPRGPVSASPDNPAVVFIKF